jgi:uncharacterized protein YbbC (DUF1343 family)
MQAHYCFLLSVMACARPAPSQVRPGIEVLLSDSIHLVRGRRLGLLSNQTGVDHAGRRDVDLLMAAGLPIYRLYGGSRRAARTDLDSIDILLIDLQDIGARYYTYAGTAASWLREAAARRKPVIVLDRPDPLGGLLVQGNSRRAIGDPDSDAVSFLPVPMRHGMTMGELERLAADHLGLHGDLTVIPVAGWRRGMAFDATGLPWINPSPNMPSLESAFHYPGLCLFEATSLSVGRGTGRAFQVIGAPWLEPEALLQSLQREAPEALAGVSIVADSFTPRGPTDGKYDGVRLSGLRFRVTDRARYDPPRLAVALLVALAGGDGGRLALRAATFDRLAGGPDLRMALAAGGSASEIWQSWQTALADFRRTRAKYLLY